MASAAPNHIKYLLATKAIDFDNDVFIIILMQSGFTFNVDTMPNYAQVSANELTTQYGYTVKDKTLTGVDVVEDDANDRCAVTWNNAVWTASGGSLTASGAIILDDTEANDALVAYIDFGSDQTVLDGGTFTVANILVELT